MRRAVGSRCRSHPLRRAGRISNRELNCVDWDLTPLGDSLADFGITRDCHVNWLGHHAPKRCTEYPPLKAERNVENKMMWDASTSYLSNLQERPPSKPNLGRRNSSLLIT